MKISKLLSNIVLTILILFVVVVGMVFIIDAIMLAAIKGEFAPVIAVGSVSFVGLLALIAWLLERNGY